MKNRTSRNSGFTLVEIMIVVAIIGLLAAIAIPNFVRARTQSQKNACINNLRQIDGAVQQWALETKQNDTASMPDGTVILPYLKSQVTCPAGGSAATFLTSYPATALKVTDKPICAFGGAGGSLTITVAANQHVLPADTAN
jgi:prepilin-type N-terminal cleavage/methylation domain-containing protein